MRADPADYNDIDIAWYRDEQGAVWCFTADQFSLLLESGTNPYNSAVLPEPFRNEITYRADALQQLRGEKGLPLSTPPTTFSEAIDSLSAPDQPPTGEEVLTRFSQLAMENRLSPSTINDITKEGMGAALLAAGHKVQLAPLTTSHALMTTAQTLSLLEDEAPEQVSRFFQALTL
jgi:hypothetical protein